MMTTQMMMTRTMTAATMAEMTMMLSSPSFSMMPATPCYLKGKEGAGKGLVVSGSDEHERTQTTDRLADQPRTADKRLNHVQNQMDEGQKTRT